MVNCIYQQVQELLKQEMKQNGKLSLRLLGIRLSHLKDKNTNSQISISGFVKKEISLNKQHEDSKYISPPEKKRKKVLKSKLKSKKVVIQKNTLDNWLCKPV